MLVSDFIEVNPNVMMGKPVIKGTRITVEIILEKLSNGFGVADIVKAYPNLNDEKIRAALAFAAELLKGDVVYPISK